MLVSIGIKPILQLNHQLKDALFQDDKISITGTVLDKATDTPIPFASVSVVGREQHVQSNGKGYFTLLLRPEDRRHSLRISSLGYVSREYKVEALLDKAGSGGVSLFLELKHRSLKEVEVTAKAQKWKAQRVGYHIDEGTSFHYRFTPSGTAYTVTAGQEIGTRIRVKRKQAVLQSVSFGLAGSGNAAVKVGVKLYSIKDNLPYQNLLHKPAIISIEPHHTGWITVDLEKHNITVEGDFALVVEWLSETTRLNSGSLMTFATTPKGQVTYYRAAGAEPWRIRKSTLLDVKSIGMYATLLYQR
ncbi:carboxypeptidase-like regulatory domain-containing protein [Pontibacter pamirensis]|uniref:carboxypeptidase-like regulatory domain-containing protein n=1 Tax=Pontibacter pamirensis TaxID=2562824 RepID=UPI001389A2C0|nr:carboxypeptidase-like regulatory domain-containing protein [Pontibacter pamirensis]